MQLNEHCLFQPIQDTFSKEGEKVTFECRIEGRPEPIVKWYREGVVIQSSPDYQITYYDSRSTLTIMEVFPEDTGNFQCVAANGGGTVMTEAFLKVDKKIKEAPPKPPSLPVVSAKEKPKFTQVRI